ncbi:MAG: hypothetical protein WC483_03275 [Candidatus Paceibacterota bacterium]|jgi:hypothetical protein
MRLSELMSKMNREFSNENPEVFVELPNGQQHEIVDARCVVGEKVGQGKIIIKTK